MVKKPYYLREPWDLLFKDKKMDRQSPWSIDLVYILTTLLEEMNKVGIDFRIAGTAINSSVIIYQKKAELLWGSFKRFLNLSGETFIFSLIFLMLLLKFFLIALRKSCTHHSST